MDKIILPESDEDLLAQCEMDTFRSGGPGGQHQNKRESGVRLRHVPTGIVAECRRERSQHLNRKSCLELIRLKVEKLNYRKPKRVKTRVSANQKAKRVESKARRSQIKSARKRPARGDE